jgi:hypothetical protein
VGWLAEASIWLYRRVLRLYPSRFRAEFAWEMGEVFASALHEAAGRGGGPLLRVVFRELLDLPLALLLEHLRERKGKEMQLLDFDTQGDLRLVRWMARGLALLFACFVASLFLFNEDVRGDLTPPTLVLALVAVALLLSWRWERLGGSLTLVGSVGLLLAVLSMALWPNLFGLDRAGLDPLGALLAGLALAFSPAILGWLFLSLAQHTEVTAGERREFHRPAWRRILIYVFIAFVAFLLLGLSLVIAPFSRTESSEGLSRQRAPIEEVLETPGAFDTD